MQRWEFRLLKSVGDRCGHSLNAQDFGRLDPKRLNGSDNLRYIEFCKE